MPRPHDCRHLRADSKHRISGAVIQHSTPRKESNLKYSCKRDRFTAEEYASRKTWFWPIPARWGSDPETSWLAKLWQLGGAGGIGILPILGMYVNASFSDELDLSKEYIARLAGLSVDSVRHGAKALDKLGLAHCKPAKRFGRWITQWCLSSELAQPRLGLSEVGAERLAPDYFYFSAKLMHGGHWSQLTAVQQALFLGLATRSRVFFDPPSQGVLQWRLRPGVPVQDLNDCHEAALAGRSHLRLVVDVSVTDLQQITGVSRRPLIQAIHDLKHPSAWPRCGNDPWKLHHAPLAVYPSDGGALIYHFRDHVEPWPCDQLNQPRRRPAPAAASDFDLPF
jgi:hypothetical protein